MPAPTVITSFPVGHPGGQIPTVHVRDVTNGYDLYTLGADTISAYPASVTKLMTLLLLYEYKHAVFDDTVVMSVADVSQPYEGITLDTCGFQERDTVSWRDIAYAILLPSSTEACQCAARTIGDDLYAAAGNTGTQGMTRFVERMNARAAELGMTNTVYFDSPGGSKTGSTTRNTISARDLSVICNAVFLNTALIPIAQAANRLISVSGELRTTQFNVGGFNRFTNGPTWTQQGVLDTNTIGGKNGVWLDSGVNHYNYSGIFTTTSGSHIVITVIGSESLQAMMYDVRGMYYQAIRDFPHLSDHTTQQADALYTSVTALVGADGSYVDESATPHTVTATSLIQQSPLVAGSTHAFGIDATTDKLLITSDAGLQVGSGDMTSELWFAGPGTLPSGEIVFMGKADHISFQREWNWNEYTGTQSFFASTDGVNWTSVQTVVTMGQDAYTFYNGAPRHLAMVKEGSVWSAYICGERQAGQHNIGTAFAGIAPISVSSYPVADVANPGITDEYRFTKGHARYSGYMFTPDPRKFARQVSPPPPPPSAHDKHHYPSPYHKGAYK